MFGNTTISDVKKRAGKLARLMRERESLTQEQLAERLALSRITIQNLEAGKNPTMDTLLKVFQHFDMLVSFDDFLKNEIENNSVPSLY